MAIWLGFHALLRPGELLGLRAIHVTFGKRLADLEDSALGMVTVIKPKTRRTAARIQHVLLEESRLCALLELWKRLTPSGPLFNFTEATFARRLRSLLRAVGCERLFGPGGLRAGGATYFWVKRRAFDQLRLRGRWKVPSSLEHYIQEAVTFLQTETEVDEATHVRAEWLAARVGVLLDEMERSLSSRLVSSQEW